MPSARYSVDCLMYLCPIFWSILRSSCCFLVDCRVFFFFVECRVVLCSLFRGCRVSACSLFCRLPGPPWLIAALPPVIFHLCPLIRSILRSLCCLFGRLPRCPVFFISQNHRVIISGFFIFYNWLKFGDSWPRQWSDPGSTPHRLLLL